MGDCIETDVVVDGKMGDSVCKNIIEELKEMNDGVWRHRSYLHHFKLILMMSIDSVVIFLALVENLVNGGNGFQIHLLNKGNYYNQEYDNNFSKSCIFFF